jgi:hypothetical protein
LNLFTTSSSPRSRPKKKGTHECSKVKRAWTRGRPRPIQLSLFWHATQFSKNSSSSSSLYIVSGFIWKCCSCEKSPYTRGLYVAKYRARNIHIYKDLVPTSYVSQHARRSDVKSDLSRPGSHQQRSGIITEGGKKLFAWGWLIVRTHDVITYTALYITNARDKGLPSRSSLILSLENGFWNYWPLNFIIF